MPILYHKPTCPYSQDVLEEAGKIGVELKLLNIKSDPAIAEELIARGGKRQVPYLVDESRGVEMYESTDIIEHLKKHYGN
ncbi:MAG: glutathione S-transferase N-terminal domain-containing protein [Candidatus Paceibacterota bacterium]